MNEKMYQMIFKEKQFNALMHHLNRFVDDSLFRKTKTYSLVIVDDEGNECISIRLFGDELRRLCWFLMVNLPEDVNEDHFTPLLETIKERDAAYQRKREEEHRTLYDGIKRELLSNPTVTGTEIVKKLNVRPDQVYAIWHQVRADIEKED